MRIYSASEIIEQARLISSNRFCSSPASVAALALDKLLPRKSIRSLAYSQEYRIIRKPDGTKAQWSLDLTPYLAPIMDAHDDPEVLEIIVPKPGRCGGTVVAENHALKMMEFGPTGDIMWYLAGPEEVRSYADRVLAPIFEDHEGVQRRIGAGKSDNNKTRKRLGGQTFELMVMSKKTTTNRQGRYIVFDEPDSYHKDFRSGFLEQGRQRQRMLGNDRKIYACAHPDVGWSGGIAAAWSGSSQGIFVMQCPECKGHASPYPTKYWPEVARFKLHYVKSSENTSLSTRLAVAERTAGILCPHCGSVLDEVQRAAMVEEGAYMHRGQEIDLKAGIIGTPDPNRTWGFWIHVLMSKQVGLGELARELEGAIEHKERTGKTDKLRQVLVRTFGEAFEGAGDVEGLDARRLKKRTEELAKDETPVGYRMGTVPDGVLFLTAAVDVGGNKFDLLVRGWDDQRRSWLIDRRTIRQRQDGAVMRDLAPSKVQEDWSVIESEIDRIYPLQSDPGQAMPIAVMTIDASDGNVTWKAYEFARRMDKKRWKSWRKVRCIKGSTNTKADPLPSRATDISKDSEGKAVEPVVTLHVLGVHKLKEDTLQDLGIEDGSPGQCYFASDTPERAYQEIFNEPLIDGSFVRNGPNETLDLYAYTEAGRLMLQPDRTSIRWDDLSGRPIWAQPVSLQPKGGDPLDQAGDEVIAPKVDTKPKPSLLERFDALNKR